MSDYISRVAAINRLQEIANDYEDAGYKDEFYAADYCLHHIIELPIAADVWEVVHCKDCANADETTRSGCVYCHEMERDRINEGWCAWGRKR